MIDLPELNLPAFDARIRHEGSRSMIWDMQRQTYVLITLEEWVRQHMIHFLVNNLNYPAGLIAVEKELKVIRLRKRFDIVVYDRALQPWMLIECKAPDIPLTQAVVDQAARYNMALKSPYLVVTNGMKYMIAAINFEEMNYAFLKEFPSPESE